MADSNENRKMGVLTVAMLLLTPLTLLLNPVTGSSSACVPNGGITIPTSCTFSSGVAAPGVYAYQSITIPAGVTVTADLVFELHGVEEVIVEGRIEATPGTAVTVTSDHLISVEGEIWGGHGLAGTPSALPTLSLGGRGGDAPPVILNSPRGVIAVGGDGIIASGDGGSGGDATAVAEFDAGIADPVAVGGPGGRGGDLVLDARFLSMNGLLILGNGGAGGSALAHARAGSIAAYGPGEIRATGGEGGASGILSLPPGHVPTVLFANGKASGGAGGEGGSAAACVGIFSNPCEGEPGDDAPTQYGTGGCSYPSFSQTGPGRDACKGKDARGEGGSGGPGEFIGGRGGSVDAVYGGNGGRGEGGVIACTSCRTDGRPAGWGGHGGNGGMATGQGGQGGVGGVLGGAGGPVNRDVKGGMGGRGGDGGGGRFGNGDGYTRCDSVNFCYRPPNDPSNVCLYPGAKGEKGYGGWAWAAGGQGGRGILGLQVGLNGNVLGNVVTGAAGNDGEDGRPESPCGSSPGYVRRP
ncbi:MAG TPA: hypothetical protein VM889_01535 [Candidatus Thermoplasmatota archaeon]|nr:hypothetical protein [Candidatus Thermoplasmatota archaeon]